MRQDLFPILAVVWILFGAAGALLFYVSKNVKFKKKYFPWFVMLAGAMALCLALGMGFSVGMLFFMLPFVALVAILNIKLTKFCENCGSTIMNQMWATNFESCAKCGAKLND